MIHSGKQLDYAYGHEPDANVREIILLLRRVRIDKQEAASAAELELHRSRGWAYKWLKRYKNEGMLGLKDKPRSGRPADVPLPMRTGSIILPTRSISSQISWIYTSACNADILMALLTASLISLATY